MTELKTTGLIESLEGPQDSIPCIPRFQTPVRICVGLGPLKYHVATYDLAAPKCKVGSISVSGLPRLSVMVLCWD